MGKRRGRRHKAFGRQQQTVGDKPSARPLAGTILRNRLQVCLIAALIIAAGMVAYHNSFAGVLLFDDSAHILHNENIRSLSPISQHLTTRRPVVTLSLATNYAFGELDVWGYHAFNLAVHILAALTLFGVVRRSLTRPRFKPNLRDAAPWLAGCVAITWVVHPLLTQSVTYVIQRGESLMGLFYLLTLYCVIRAASARRPLAWSIAAVVACALGMGSKAVMVTAPIVILIYDRTFLAGSFRQAVRLRWPLYLGLAATLLILVANGVATGVLNPNRAGSATVGFAFTGITPLEYLATQTGVILHYLRLTFWPDALCIDYGWPVAKTVSQIVPAGSVVVVLLAATIWACVRRPAIGFLGVWFFLVLAPTSSFIPIKDPIFEHRMYLPLAAVVAAMMLVGRAAIRYLVRQWPSDHPGQRVIPVAIVLVAVATLTRTTIHRNNVYHSRSAMWTDAASKRPTNARSQTNLGIAAFDAGLFDISIEACRRAVKLDPDRTVAHLHLALALHRTGQLAEALEACRTVQRLDPKRIEAYVTASSILNKTKKFEDAIEECRLAIEIDPECVDAYYNLGTALKGCIQYARAIEAYHSAQQRDPHKLEAFIECGNIFALQQRQDAAAEEFRKAIEAATPKSDAMLVARAHFNLANTLARLDKLADAVDEYRAAVRIVPDYANAHFGLGWALKQQGKLDEAVESLREAIKIMPDHEQAREMLGVALEEQNVAPKE